MARFLGILALVMFLGALIAVSLDWKEPVAPSAVTARPPTLAARSDELESPRSLVVTPIEPLSPREALAAFRIEPGFRIELVAAEPNVVDPIALAWDEDGRLFVAEDIDYPYPPAIGAKPLGRVRLLDDIDGDGLFERSVIFADAVQWPSGIACWKGGVFVAAPPRILYLKDTDGDGRADVREVVYDGFGTAAAEDIMNNLRWGLDHRIYGAASYNGGDVHRPGQSEDQSVSVRDTSFRFDPVTLKFETLPGTGDFGNCFDDWGNRFVANAGNVLMHAVIPGSYFDRNPHATRPPPLHKSSASKVRMHSISSPEPWRVARKKNWQRWVNTTPNMRSSRFSEKELAEGGWVTGAAGCEIYRGETFPSEYHGNSFTAEPAGNVVIRLALQAKGVTFDAFATSENREFLASTDNWFRPVNVFNGPDGAVYVCDMYREIIEDPSAIPDDILKLIDVTRGRDRGRIWRIVPQKFNRPAPPRLSRASIAELVEQLGHENSWQRETAARLLFERQDKSAVMALRAIVMNGASPTARLHALGVLVRLEAADAEVLLAALNDQHPDVRRVAIRQAEARLNDSVPLADRAIELADDDQPQIRLQAAFSLGAIKDGDRLPDVLATILLRDSDEPYIKAAVLSSAAGHEVRLFAALIGKPELEANVAAPLLLAELAASVAARNRDNDVEAILKMLGTAPLNRHPAWQRPILLATAEALGRSGASLGDLSARAGDTTRFAADRFAEFQEQARHVANDREQSIAQRTEAIRLLRHAPFKIAADQLAGLLHAGEPIEVQLAAVQSLAAQDELDAARRLLDRWDAMSPCCHSETIEALFRDRRRIDLLLAALEQTALPPFALSPPRRQQLLTHRDAIVRERAEKLLQREDTGDRKAVVDRYQIALRWNGDADRGAQVFSRNCAACHRFRNEGKNVGPDLTSIQSRAPDALLVSILDPSREVSTQYVNYSLLTVDGRSLSGMLAAETAVAVTLRRAEGAEDVIDRKNIEELVPSRQSLMPEGFEQQIDERQMADLLVYLSGR